MNKYRVNPVNRLIDDCSQKGSASVWLKSDIMLYATFSINSTASSILPLWPYKLYLRIVRNSAGLYSVSMVMFGLPKYSKGDKNYG